MNLYEIYRRKKALFSQMKLSLLSNFVVGKSTTAWNCLLPYSKRGAKVIMVMHYSYLWIIGISYFSHHTWLIPLPIKITYHSMLCSLVFSGMQMLFFPVCVDDFKPEVSSSILMTMFCKLQGMFKHCTCLDPQDHVSSRSLRKYVGLYVGLGEL